MKSRKLTKAQKAALYDYLRYIENANKPASVRKEDFVVIATDGTEHWGTTFDEACEKAMIQDGWGRLPVYGKKGTK